MDHEFPGQLFPSFYNCGPPDSAPKPDTGGSWGSYGRVRPQGGSGPLSGWMFTPSHQVRGETWRPTEPVPLPLLSPKRVCLWPSKPPDPLNFTEHMQNFFIDHSQDAFGCMSELLGENFNFRGVRKRYQKDSVSMSKVKNCLDMLNLKICHRTYFSRTLGKSSALLSDVVHSVPPELLGALLFEELSEQRDRLLFSEAATGGALAFIPFPPSCSASVHGCLIYPGNQGLGRLNFHRVELQHHRGSSSTVDAGSRDPFSFLLKAPVRQISATSLFNNSCVAVRSDYLCGVWMVSERKEPRLLQVVNTREVATCISVSPHILGEVLVASESGTVNLWTVGRGMQMIREDSSNLYFNAKSPWRWCEFSAHPRVMLYADRTGVELTDIRTNPCSGHTLFCISNTSECRSGERLILSRYLGDVHSFHHLITTQYSAYIMDERFPCVPVVKWDHMMQSPPLFCHVLPGSSSPRGDVDRSTKVLLGSQSSQEITLLQYSGGRAEACFSRGPPQALLTPRESLKQLPVQIPHRQDTASARLSSPAAGLSCLQKKAAQGADGEECICLLQLTEAGDIFYQILTSEQPDGDAPRPLAAEDEPLLKKATTTGRTMAEEFAPDSQPDVVDASNDEDMIGPTQAPVVSKFVAETPEREQPAGNMHSDSDNSGGRSQKLKQLWLQVIVNDDPEPDHMMSGSEAGEKAEDTRESSGGEETFLRCESQVKPSKAALTTWKHWLQKLMHKSHKKKPRPHRLHHLTIKAQDFLHLPGDEEEAEEEQRVQSLRRDLRACMSKRSLLLHSTGSTSLPAPDVVPAPDQVDTDVWRDQLSQRMTLSWQGEEAWRAWWVDELGLNREEKLKALRRKRRREKERKRAAGRRLELSGSFTSSISYQTDLDTFSDSTACSSATSWGAWSDQEGAGMLSHLESFLENGTPRASTLSTVQNDSPTASPVATPQKHKEAEPQAPGSSRTPSLSQAVKPDSTAAGPRKNRRLGEDYLHFLFAAQDEPSPHTYPLEEESSVQGPLLPTPSSSSSSSRPRGSQGVSQGSLRTGLLQDSSVWSGFSQSLPPSQSSQGRLGLSQASQVSQPKKKKSRMGF